MCSQHMALGALGWCSSSWGFGQRDREEGAGTFMGVQDTATVSGEPSPAVVNNRLVMQHNPLPGDVPRKPHTSPFPAAPAGTHQGGTRQLLRVLTLCRQVLALPLPQ